MRERQRRLGRVDTIVLSLVAKGVTTGEVSAHFEEINGASLSKDTISKITDRVLTEMAEWAARPLEKVYAAIGVDLAGHKDVLGCGPATGTASRRSPRLRADEARIHRPMARYGVPSRADALGSDLDKATVSTLQRRIFTLPGRLVHSGRRHLRLPASWPWAHAIAQVLTTIHAIPLRC